ncbi:MAG: hypothetical protein A2Z77_00535 [Chloroflexi bacterium RBG_13_51_36]|nr:MAG: hypothetical protein A2Z77_00535 [Chloroflexi bacterium RBG_13_51_36]
MNLIRLGKNQLRSKKYEHPAFEGVRIFSQEELAALVEKRLMTGDKEPLILALRSTARFLIGCYLWHYPAARRFLDEMVGEALLAITKLVHVLNRDMLVDTGIQKIAAWRICARIDTVLNLLQSISAPSVSTQRKYIKSLGWPIYIVSVREPCHDDKQCPDAEVGKFDMLDALDVLRDDCEMAARILEPDNWGLDDAELAESLGCTREYAGRCRRNLLLQFLKLVGESK